MDNQEIAKELVRIAKELLNNKQKIAATSIIDIKKLPDRKLLDKFLLSDVSKYMGMTNRSKTIGGMIWFLNMVFDNWRDAGWRSQVFKELGLKKK